MKSLFRQNRLSAKRCKLLQAGCMMRGGRA